MDAVYWQKFSNKTYQGILSNFKWLDIIWDIGYINYAIYLMDYHETVKR